MRWVIKVIKNLRKNTFLWWLLLTSLIPLFFAIFLLDTVSQIALEKKIFEELYVIAEKKMVEIEALLQNSKKLADVLSENPLFKEVLSKERKTNEQLDKNSQEAIAYRLLIDKLLIYSKDLMNLYKYTDIFLFNANDQLIFSLNSPQLIGQNSHNLANEQLDKVLDLTKVLVEPQLSDLIYSDDYSEPQLYITSPIFEKGKVIGYLVLQSSNTFIESTIQDLAGLGDTGEVLVGTVVNGNIEPAVDLRHANNVEFMAGERNLDSAMQKAFLNATLGTKSKGYMRDYRKKEVLATTRYLPSMDWGLLVKVDADEALAPAIKLKYNMLALGIITAISAFILAYLVSDRLQKDQNELTRVMGDLEVAKEAVDKANQAKSQFLSNMSHELRTPLNAVIGYSEMLSEELEEKGVVEFLPDLGKINMAGKHLLSLINDVLDISKIEAGKMELFFTDIDLKQLLSEIEVMAKPLAATKHNRFILKCSPLVQSLHNDPTKLRQCLLNLIGNACKFTEDGVVTLNVEPIELEGKPGIKFDVIDTGVGISEENLNRLFQAFVQVASPLAQGGTGLGLYLTLKFSHMMGGKISVLSVIDKGTTFTMTLPLIPVENGVRSL
jgi:signal transduction histidine kinase